MATARIIVREPVNRKRPSGEGGGPSAPSARSRDGPDASSGRKATLLSPPDGNVETLPLRNVPLAQREENFPGHESERESEEELCTPSPWRCYQRW